MLYQAFVHSVSWLFVFGWCLYLQVKSNTYLYISPPCICVVAVSKECIQFPIFRWAKTVKPCWTNFSDLWPQAALIHWRHQQTTQKRCTTSWTSSTRCYTTRDSWKTSGSTAKCGCTNVYSSVSFNKTSNRYTHTNTHTVYMFLFICMHMIVQTHDNSKTKLLPGFFSITWEG